MRSAKTWLNSFPRREGKGAGRVFVVCYLLALILSGCTVTPQLVKDSRPSFDGNVANSGFIGFDADGRGIITPHARERYNALIEKFGTKLVPPLKSDAGVIPTATNTFLLDAQHVVDFATMNRWNKTGR